MDKAETTVVTLRIPTHILKAVDRKAEKNERTRQDYIRLVLKRDAEAK